MMLEPVPDRTYSDAELDSALTAIAAPGRLNAAQDVVLRTMPSLQHILASVLAGGGWFETGHAEAVRAAAGADTPSDREREVQTLVAEETRLGMMVGVAIGLELARELDVIPSGDPPPEDPNPRVSADHPPEPDPPTDRKTDKED